jgi:GntR family transcriptional regulator
LPELKIALDFRSGVPIYAQIVEQITRQVLDGTLRVGDQLPTVRQLAADLRINFNTVARAYRLLDENGLISTQQGRGTYILEKPTPDHEQRLRRETLSALTEQYLAEVRRLGFGAAEALEAVHEALKRQGAHEEDG